MKKTVDDWNAKFAAFESEAAKRVMEREAEALKREKDAAAEIAKKDTEMREALAAAQQKLQETIANWRQQLESAQKMSEKREGKLLKTCDGLQMELTNLRNAKEQMEHKLREQMAQALAAKDAEYAKARDELQAQINDLTAQLHKLSEEAAAKERQLR